MSSILPPIRAIQVFETVARHGTVSAAARELGISPSAVSQQLRLLESVLGLALVERRGRSIALTASGQDYAAGLEEAFGQLRRAHQRMADLRQGSRLVLSCLPSFAVKWLAPPLLTWSNATEGANVQLLASEAEPALDGSVDLRVTYGEAGRSHGRHVELFRDWVMPACAPALAARLRFTHPRDLFAAPLLHVEWDQSHRPPPGWADLALRLGFERPAAVPALTFSLSVAAIDAAIDGQGIVLGQHAMIARDLAEGRLVCPFPLRLSLPEPYYLAWHPGAFDKPLGRQLHTFVQREGRRMRGAWEAEA